MKYASLLFTALLLNLCAHAQTVSVDTFATYLKQNPPPQLIDVRTPGEFGEGHLPGAVNINSQRPDFTQALTALDKNKPVLVYCLGGGRSKVAAEKLREMGYTDVRDLRGGYLKWASKMMPVEGVTRSTATPEWTPARFDSLLRAQPLVFVDVYAPWCAPCKKMMPLVDKLAQELTGQVTVVKFNADTEKAMLTTYQVDELPTLLVFRNGKLADRQTGFHDEPALRAMMK